MDKDYKPHTEQITIHKRKTNNTEITNSYFQNILNVMAKKKPHKSLKQYVNNLSLPPCALGKEKYITSEKHSVDKVALALYPSDVPNQHTKRLPVLCCADGNCLSHCGEIFSASSHVEIRVRIIVESVLHESKYLDPSFLSVGIPENKTNLVTAYTMYSDFYKPGTLRPITENTSQYYFRKETLAITHDAAFMGIWQMFALASVLQTLICSIYPVKGNPNVRNDFHRIIMRKSDHTVHILWTSTRQDMTNEHWVPNHFVPVIPLHGRMKKTIHWTC